MHSVHCLVFFQFFDTTYKMNCKICGDLASGYYNSGDLSCSSCRVFFRRMAQKKTINGCVLNGNCEITLQNRSHSCRYCRYQKCLSIGMDPHRVGGMGKVNQHFHREPISLEATITEETWTENALAIVSKVRTSQEDVDMIASWVAGLKVSDSIRGNDDRAWANHLDNLTRNILNGIVNDLDNLRLDHDASTAAYLLMNIGGVESGNMANDIKHYFNIFPTQFELFEKVKASNFKDFYKDALSPEDNEFLGNTIKEISYFTNDHNIYSLLLLSVLTGNQEDASNLNRTLNKMLLKQLHKKYPYQGDDIIKFIKGQLVNITKILPYIHELPKNQEDQRFEEITQDTKMCQFCQTLNPIYFCSKCKMVSYCNKSCQANDWPSHILHCI